MKVYAIDSLDVPYHKCNEKFMRRDASINMQDNNMMIDFTAIHQYTRNRNREQ